MVPFVASWNWAKHAISPGGNGLDALDSDRTLLLEWRWYPTLHGAILPAMRRWETLLDVPLTSSATACTAASQDRAA